MEENQPEDTEIQENEPEVNLDQIQSNIGQMEEEPIPENPNSNIEKQVTGTKNFDSGNMIVENPQTGTKPKNFQSSQIISGASLTNPISSIIKPSHNTPDLPKNPEIENFESNTPLKQQQNMSIGENQKSSNKNTQVKNSQNNPQETVRNETNFGEMVIESMRKGESPSNTHNQPLA